MTAVVRALALALLLVALPGCTVTGGGSDLRLVAELDDAAGLFVGNDVGILGVPVGEVTSIEPAGDVVRVHLRIDADHADLPDDVGAVVVSRSVATDRYVELTPVVGREAERRPRIADGATIPLARTRTPVEFDEVLASLEELSSGLAGKDGKAGSLRRLLRAAADTLDGQGTDARATVRDLAEAAKALSDQREDLTGTVEDVDDLAGTIVADRVVISRFITAVTDAADLFADERDDFGAALRALSRALRSLAAFVRDNRTELRNAMKGLTRVSDNLLEHQRALAEALETSPLTFENLGNTIGDDGRLDLRLPPTDLAPSELAIPLCRTLPSLCEGLGTDPDLGTLVGVLGDVLGGGRGGTPGSTP